MSSARKVRVESSERACQNCRNRKTRCIVRARQSICAHCFKAGKECIFNDKPERTPLTRRNLDSAEARCRELEATLRNRFEETGSNAGLNGAHVLPPLPDAGADAPRDENENESLGQADVAARRGNEWHEESSLQDTTDQDGMASFTSPGKATGYLGSSSGSALLQSLSTYLSPNKDRPTPRSQNSQQESPEVPRDVLQFLDIASSSRISISAAEEHYVNAYFIGYNSSYPLVHERTFREQCVVRSRLPSSDMWHVLYYIVVAIGEWVCGQATDCTSLYFEAARSRMSFEILESGSMRVVQILLLLGNYLQKRDKPNTAYNFIGLAYRMALGLGLHRELPSGRGVDAFALQQRRVLFWTLYSFDSGFSMTTGRPTLVSDTFIDIRKPTNVDDSLTSASDDVLHEVDYPTTYSAIIAQARLAVIANKIYANFLSVRACSDVDDLVATMEQTIRNWRHSLPSFFFAPDVPRWFLGPRQVVLWKEANLQIALLLASQRNHIEDQDRMSISNKCQTTAMSTIFDISQFCLDHVEIAHVGLSWYAVYFLLHAVLALGLHQVARAKQTKPWQQNYAHNGLSAKPETAILKARECLEVLGRSNKAALRTLQILDRIEETLGRPASGEHRGTTFSMEQHPLTPHQSVGGPSQRPPSSAIITSIAPRTAISEGMPSSSIQGIFPDTSPQGYADFVMDEWVGTADPSLHFFFDNGTDELNDVFQGLQGFPNVLDADNFGNYMTSTMHSVRVPEHNQHSFHGGNQHQDGGERTGS